MAFYDEMAAAALEMISEFGQELTLKRVTPGAYDPSTGSTTPDVIDAQPIQVVVLQASKGTIESFDNRFEGGTLIESSLRSLKIAAKDLLWPPEPGYLVTLDGKDWTMIGVTPSNPGGTPLVYTASIKV